MLRPLATSDHAGHHEPPGSPTQPSRAKKASTACLACKQRKTKCSGGNPCEQCGNRNSDCIYDLAADQRRKVANQRNVKELAQRMEEVERHRVILGAILAILRAGSSDSVQDLIKIVQNRASLPDLAIYLDTSLSAAPAIREAYEEIDFDLDDSPTHPTGVDEGSAAAGSSTTRTGERMQIDQGQTREGPGLTPGQLRASLSDAMRADDITPHAIHRTETDGSDGASSVKSVKSNPSNRPWELS